MPKICNVYGYTNRHNKEKDIHYFSQTTVNPYQ